MSLVLAPIHEMMYQKVLRQDNMSEALLDFAEETMAANGLREKVDSIAPAALKQPLKDIIDSSNIHGWLNSAVVQSEQRLAQVAAGILENHPERLEHMMTSIRVLGKQETFPVGLSAEEVLDRLGSALLDGMPCDRSLEIESTESEQATWNTAYCSHEPHWKAVNISPEVFYKLRDAWINGTLSQSGYIYEREGLRHHISKEG